MLIPGTLAMNTETDNISLGFTSNSPIDHVNQNRSLVNESTASTSISNKDYKYLTNSAVSFQKQSIVPAEMIGTQITTILVIYAGGTIGMMKDTQNVYCPIPGYLHRTLSERPNFHDASFFKSVQNCELYLTSNYSVKDSKSIPSKPINQSGFFEFAGHPLITPASIHNKRMLYFILEYEQLLDSSNMTMSDWIRIAADIERYYHNFDAFLILHGTDTMSYTASALSFLLENLGKPVIITGSQIPLSELRNDASDNLLGALTIAGHYVIPEVGLYFNNRLIRGNRSTKQKAMDFDAFDSPNLKPLARVGVNIEIDWLEVLKPTSLAPFRAHNNLDPNVLTLRLFPGITESTVQAFLNESIRGIVLETFGAGNAPNNRPEILKALKEAVDRGVIIVNCTQCPKGTVSDLYATGRALHDAGVLPGHDMTTEAALTKLSFLLAQPGYSLSDIKSQILENIRGELTLPSNFTSGHMSTGRSVLSALIKSISQKTSAERTSFECLLRPSLMSLAASSGDMIALRGFINSPNIPYNSVNPTTTTSFTCYDHNGTTPLHSAVRSKQVLCLEWLLKHGANVHQRDASNLTALILAISLLESPESEEEVDKINDMINLLVQTGALINPNDVGFKRLFFQSIIEGNFRITEKFISLGVKPYTVTDIHHRKIEHYIPISPDPDHLKFILNKKR